MKFYIFASGSKGNATLIIDKRVHLLIDLGISRNQIKKELTNLNLKIDDIDFILLTHEHYDHIKGLENIKSIPIYGGENTYSSENFLSIKPYINFKYKHLTILPIQTSHDAHNPLGYIISNNKEKLVYITDTGCINERNMELAKNADYYIIESNHNREMLLKTKRPVYVKERIMSEFGHLCNDDAALYLSAMIGNKTKQIFLAHVSMEANRYELAKETCINYLKKKRINIDKIDIEAAYQYKTSVGGVDEN